ncbi:unnamed protein product [Nesidiocoris tenuis]|uniref:Uncharacterized protein n=1 Tax=Nesidiocoris tenuis TaxID=355587 RepID=A0A6H5H578_9HEMI|nr:unnamed protein product [Nesidiocoris tenuis]
MRSRRYLGSLVGYKIAPERPASTATQLADGGMPRNPRSREFGRITQISKTKIEEI